MANRPGLVATEAEYDVVILDLNLPKLDGVSVLRYLRAKKPSVPVLVLTQRTRVEDRVQCLDTGARRLRPQRILWPHRSTFNTYVPTWSPKSTQPHNHGRCKQPASQPESPLSRPRGRATPTPARSGPRSSPSESLPAAPRLFRKCCRFCLATSPCPSSSCSTCPPALLDPSPSV